MDASSVIEIAVRGAAAGGLLVIAVLHGLKGRGFGPQRLAALFAFGTAAYTFVSTPVSWDALGEAILPLAIIASYNSVFFWWVSTALFDDDFAWEPWRFLPVGLLTLFVIWRLVFDPDDNLFRSILHQGLVIGFMGHALWLAVTNRKDDLVEPRRRFRLVFAFVVGITGVVIAIGEVLVGTSPPPWLSLFHSAALGTLVLGFSLWLLEPRDVFAAATPPVGPRRLPGEVSAADEADLGRLDALMRVGIYRREGLTVGALAAEVGVPEHRLRQLINGALGYQNFSAFLNTRRIADAKAALENPANVRKQILQVALDVGYGSVGPFNRAFKAAAGMTPTEYRRKALGE